MAQPVFYQTLNMVGLDPAVYYTNVASVTPETPAPPFIVGTQGFGSDGSQFVFVQASTSISLSDFVVLSQGTTSSPSLGIGYVANSVTNTNVVNNNNVALAATGLVVKQSVSFIPAGAYFWALVRGQNVPAFSSGANQLATNAGGVYLFTTATAGQITSVTANASLAVAFAGVVCINSITLSTGISASVVPPIGTLSTTGLTLGPVVTLNTPRTVVVVNDFSTGGQQNGSLYAAW